MIVLSVQHQCYPFHLIYASREGSASPRGLCNLALGFVTQVPPVNRLVMLEILRIAVQHSANTPQHTATHALRLHHALPRTQRLGVLLPATTDRLARVPAVLLQEVIADDPRRKDDVDHAERVAEEVRALHLLAHLPERAVVLLARGRLRLGRLPLEQAVERRDDVLGDVVDPEADVRAVERVGGEEVRRVGGVGVLEELADDERFVERAALVLDGGDEALRVDVL